MSQDRKELIRMLREREQANARDQAIQDIVDQAPPLKPEQRDKLQAVFRSVPKSP